MRKVVKNYTKLKRGKYKRKKSDARFKDVLYIFLSSLFAATLLISYSSMFIDPTKFWVPMFFGIYFIPLLAINILIFFWGVIGIRKASILIPLLAILPSLAISDRFVKIENDADICKGENIKVLSYNLGRYRAGSKDMTPESCIVEVRNFLRSEKADIVCLQEFAASDTSALSSYLPDYPYKASHLFRGTRYFGNVTLSKYPIVETEKITFEGSTNLAIASDIKIGKRLIRVYNCHLESNSLSFTSIIKRLFKRNSFQEEVVHVHERLKEASIKRSFQVKTVLDSEAASCCPTIVCGDLNDSPMSYTYHKLVSRKKDSFEEAGNGMSATYALLWPLLRIDYILLPTEYNASHHTVTKAKFSDHYPISTYIYFQ